MNNVIKNLLYGFHLKSISNRELFDECMDKVYGQVKFDEKGMVIDEMLDRIDNENDQMKRELKQGIL